MSSFGIERIIFFPLVKFGFIPDPSQKLSVTDKGDVEVNEISRTQRTDVNFVFQGDSRTAKLAPNGVPVETQYPSLGIPYPNQLMLMSNFKDRGNYINTNQFGNTVEGIISSYAEKVYPYRPGTTNNGVLITESYLILEIGINNCTGETNINTIRSLANLLVDYAKQAELDGFKVCLTCVIFAEAQTYSVGVDVEANRKAFNEVLKSRANEYYMLIDMEHIFGVRTDRMYWAETSSNTPILHLNQLGNYVRANYVNSLFIAGRNTNFVDHQYIAPAIRTVALSGYAIDLNKGEDFTKTCAANSQFTIVNPQIKKPFRLIITGGSLMVPTFSGYTVNWILTSLVTDYVPANTNYLICEIRSAGQIYCFWGA